MFFISVLDIRVAKVEKTKLYTLDRSDIIMLKLREITSENFDECINLKVHKEQGSFVASNVYSLAQAWLYHRNIKPFAICHDKEIVGFLMLDTDYKDGASEGICDLWRFMIDKNHQGKGYGRVAMQALINYAKETLTVKKIRTAFVPGNTVAEKLYSSLGFIPNGEVDGDEIVMILDLHS